MAIVNKDTLKNWFLRGMKPLSSQFADWMDSYWHKSEKISTVNIDKLDDILGTKAEYNDLQAHLNDVGNPHQVTAKQLGIDINVNLSLYTDESTNTINNTHGDGITLSTASVDDAGLMSTDDRLKMDMLFDGTMLDKTNPIGYHTHNYLEMSDLPQTIELAAATYGEFKAAVIKLQTEAIAQGKYGRIVQTNNWIRNDDTVFDLTNIEISNPAGRHIEVTNYPLYLKGRCLFQFLYLINRQALTVDNKLMLEFIESNRYDFLEINKLQLTNGFGTSDTTTTPVLKITGSNAVTVDIKKILCFTFDSALYGERPFVIETSKFSERLTLKLSNSELPLGKKIYLKLDSIPEVYGLDVIVDSSLYLESNLDITNSIQQIQKKFNDLNAVDGLVPSPTPLQKNAGYFLNALGEWIAPANSRNADTVEDSGWLNTTETPVTGDASIMRWGESACMYRIVGKQCYFQFFMLPGTITGSCNMVIKLPATLFDRIIDVFAETGYIYSYQNNAVEIDIYKRVASSKELLFTTKVSTLPTSDSLSICFSYPLD